MLEVEKELELDTSQIIEFEKKIIYNYLKRLLDIFCASIGLLLLLPLFAIVAFLIKRESPDGCVFFSQKRVGKDGELFTMYKFRSMVTDAEAKLADLLQHNEIQGAMFKMKEDPRITKIGKIIRKTSIDELPQLWNVLKGDMSLVGPRPPLEREVAEYTAYDKQRLRVSPGCTGLWQVSGRNDLDFHQMVQLDLQYIEERSIVNDISIILRTVTVMLRPNSGY